MEVKLYQIIDKFNKRKIRFTKSHLIVLNKMQPYNKTKYISKFELYIKKYYRIC